MKITAVVASHYQESYVHQLFKSFLKGASGVCSDIVSYDLYALAFNPVMHGDDFNQFLGGSISQEILNYQSRLDETDVLALFYPVWWNDMPAILKGWVDRVFSKGFAYQIDAQGDRGLLRIQRVILVCTLGNSGESQAQKALESAMRLKEKEGVFGYCGIEQVDHVFLHDVYSSAEKRNAYLNDILILGRELGVQHES